MSRRNRPTVVFATSGPGLSNALTGLFAAAWEGAHVVAVVGCTPSARAGRFPFQRTVPEQIMLGPWLPPDVAFSTATLTSPADLLAAVERLDGSLRCGAGSLTVLLLPSDAHTVLCDPVAAPAVFPPPPDPDVLSVARALDGKRVLCWVGHGARHAADLVREFAEVAGAVVVVTPRGKGIFDERDPRCLGVLGLGGARGVAERVQAAQPDIAVVLGARISEFTSWWDPRLVPPDGFVHVGSVQAATIAPPFGARNDALQQNKETTWRG